MLYGTRYGQNVSNTSVLLRPILTMCPQSLNKSQCQPTRSDWKVWKLKFWVSWSKFMEKLSKDLNSLDSSVLHNKNISSQFPFHSVSDYGLDDRAIGVRSPAGAKDFSSSLCVQTGSGAHPASCPVGTGGPFPGVKRGRGVMLTTHPYLVPRS
jgi:hypothetical protein